MPNGSICPYGFGADIIYDRRRKRITGEKVWFCIRDLKFTLSVFSNEKGKVSKVNILDLNRGN
jgi:hypothetical protein